MDNHKPLFSFEESSRSASRGSEASKHSMVPIAPSTVDEKPVYDIVFPKFENFVTEEEEYGKKTAREIGAKLGEMCDKFDREFMRCAELSSNSDDETIVASEGSGSDTIKNAVFSDKEDFDDDVTNDNNNGPPNKKKKAEQRDEQVDEVTKLFEGLSLGNSSSSQ